MNRLPRIARLGLALALGIAGVVGARHLAFASDHQDTADVELNPSEDMTDFYAFPGATSDRTTLVLNSWPVITPAQVMPKKGRIVMMPTTSTATCATLPSRVAASRLMRPRLSARLVQRFATRAIMRATTRTARPHITLNRF